MPFDDDERDEFDDDDEFDDEDHSDYSEHDVCPYCGNLIENMRGGLECLNCGASF